MPFWLQMVSKWVGPITSGEQPCNQEVAVQLTFCLNRSFYLRISLVTNFREWCNASLPAFARSCTARNPACCYPELSILRHTPCHKLVTWLRGHHLAHLRQVCLATVEWQLVAATRLQLSSYGTSLDFYGARKPTFTWSKAVFLGSMQHYRQVSLITGHKSDF